MSAILPITRIGLEFHVPALKEKLDALIKAPSSYVAFCSCSKDVGARAGINYNGTCLFGTETSHSVSY